MSLSTYILLYLIVGIIITIISILWYRPTGTPFKKGELLLAIIGCLIWPLQIIKWITDYFKIT